MFADVALGSASSIGRHNSVAQEPLYSLAGYVAMIQDEMRTDSYRRALCQMMEPDSVVVDLGAGLGILSFLACQMGARKVYAIEPDNIIELAHEVAVANGFAERIVFLQNVSTVVTLPEQVDLVISDLHGVLPFFGQSVPSIIDARTRFLKDGATMIPRSETLWAGLLDAPDGYQTRIGIWDDKLYDVSWQSVRRKLVNNWYKARFTLDQLLAEPLRWASIDYASVQDPNISGKVTWTIERPALSHGLGVWFETFLADGISFSTGPASPETVYKSAFFPWAEPIHLETGDSVSVALRANFVGDQYVWVWQVMVFDQGRLDSVKVSLTQSDFAGSLISTKQLRKQALDYVPDANEDAYIDRLILEQIDGHNSLAEIARQAWELFPARFRSFDDALARVRALSLAYVR